VKWLHYNKNQLCQGCCSLFYNDMSQPLLVDGSCNEGNRFEVTNRRYSGKMNLISMRS